MSEIARFVVPSSSKRHRLLESGLVHPTTVVDDAEADEPRSTSDEPDEHVGGPRIDRVVHQIRDGGFDGVVQSDGVHDPGVRGDHSGTNNLHLVGPVRPAGSRSAARDHPARPPQSGHRIRGASPRLLAPLLDGTWRRDPRSAGGQIRASGVAVRRR